MNYTIGQQMTIPQLTSYMSQTRVQLGAAGELLVARALEERGYRVSTSHHKKAGDLTIITDEGQIVYIEVKTARRGTDGKWHFTLYKKGSQDHTGADVVILLCITKSGSATPFVIPISALENQHQACITSYPTTYGGRLAQFRQTIRKLRIDA